MAVTDARRLGDRAMADSPSPSPPAAAGVTVDDARLLDALRGASWPSRRAVRTAVPGAHQSRMRGTSAEFTEYRPYRQGDDPRRLDWKLFARSDRAFIRLAADRAVLATMVVVDASASMAFPVATRAKWALARRVALGLAAVARADGDPVGLTVPGDAEGARPAGAGRGRVLPPRSRRGVVAEIARTLHDVAPRGAAPLAPMVAAARGVARLVVISDFLGDADEVLRVAREHVARGGEVTAVHVIAAEELEPAGRAITAVDPDAPDLRRPFTNEMREAYRARFAAWRAELARAWRDAGAGFVPAVTGEAADRTVRRIVAGQGEAAQAGASA